MIEVTSGPNSRPRNAHLVLLLAAAFLVILTLVGGWLSVNWAEREILKYEARASAANWAVFLRENLTDLQRVVDGQEFSETDIKFIDSARKAGNIFRYKFFGADGQIVHASRSQDIGKSSTDWYFRDLVRHGQTFAKIEVEEDFGASIKYVSEAYAPLMDGDRFLGAVEVYVDVSERAALLDRIGHIAFIAFVFALLIPCGIMGALIVRHIRQQDRTTTALRESEERFRNSVISAPIPIYMHAEGGEILLVSNKWTEVTGYGLADIPTTDDWVQRAYNGDPERLRQQTEVISQLYSLTDNADHQTEIITASGEKRIWHFRDAPLGALADGRRFVISIVNDVTEQKEAEDALHQTQKMEVIGQLTGGIAHDFNNILMVTDGYTRRALKNADDPEAVRDALGQVLIGTDRAALLTKQLLSFSRRQILEKRVFRACEAIGDIESLLKNSIGETCELIIEDRSNNACVETDASELQQALLNLVINARDAMPHGGKIAITTQLVEWDQRSKAAPPKMAADRYVEISIADEGTGFDGHVAAHIFEPFFTTKDQGKGTGLGLAMVYGFATNSGGTVTVDSTIGEGTTFKIYLPAVDRDPQAIVAEVDEEHVGNGETILLVEDDPSLLDIVRDMLEALNYSVITACDGFEAIEAEADHEGTIGLLLSDVVMPNMGGFEAAQIIREERPDIKIVFMSGYPNRAGISSEDIPEDCQILQKPVKPANLAKAIRQGIDGTVPTDTSEKIEEIFLKHA